MARLREEPVRLKQNPYRGPNAHLLSLQQTPDRDNSGLWQGFHIEFIGHIAEALNSLLPDGYIAVNDKSLQLIIESSQDGERPPAIDAYSPADQARIAERMRAIVASVESPPTAL